MPGLHYVFKKPRRKIGLKDSFALAFEPTVQKYGVIVTKNYTE